MELICNIENDIKNESDACSVSLNERIFMYLSHYLSQCHLDIGINVPRYEGPCMVYRHEWYHKELKKKLYCFSINIASLSFMFI